MMKSDQADFRDTHVHIERGDKSALMVRQRADGKIDADA
jgi:hypothetical protein